MSNDPGRCISCGFLSKIPSDPGYGLPDEPAIVFPEDRDNPSRMHRIKHGSVTGTGTVVCLLRLPIFGEPIDHNTLLNSGPAVRQNLARERNCGEWVLFNPALTPKEHLMQRVFATLEQDRREFFAEAERVRMDFEARQEQARQAFDAAQDKSRRDFEKAIKRRDWWLAGAAILLAIVQVVAALIALTPDSVGGRWFRLSTTAAPTATTTQTPAPAKTPAQSPSSCIS